MSKKLTNRDVSDPAVDAEPLTEAESIAVDIIHSVPIQSEPKDEMEALTWQFTGKPTMPPFKELMAEAKKRARNDDQFLKIMKFIWDEGFRRRIQFREATYVDPSTVIHEMNERLDRAREESANDVDSIVSELRLLIAKIRRLNSNSARDDQQDVSEQRELYKIRIKRLIRRLSSIGYETMWQAADEAGNETEKESAEDIIRELKQLLGDDFLL